MQVAAPEGRSRTFATVAAGWALLGGLVTLAGWAFGLPTLTTWGPAGINMKANAAVCCVALGVALLTAVRAPRRRAWRIAPALLAAAIGGATLVQHVTGADLGIDQFLFVEEPGAIATTAPGRMGPPASTSFLALGVALILAGVPRLRRAAAGLASAALAISALSLVGYAYGASQLYAFARLTGISLQTATIVAVLALGLFALVPEHGLVAGLRRDDAGGVVLRRLALPVTVVPLVLGASVVRGVRAGLYDAPFATALFALAMVGVLLTIVWWTADGISRHARAAREAGDALRASEQLLARALDAGRMYAWTRDLATNTSTRSASAPDVIGLGVDAPIEQFWAAVHPDDLALVKSPPAVDASGEFSAECRVYRPDDGRLVWLHSRARVERDADGHAVRLHGISWDVTEVKQAEEALRLADRRKDEFLATLAHELRNPLAPLRNALQIIRLTDDRAARDKARAVAERQVGHMVRLIDDLMDVSRITGGRLRLQKDLVAIETIVASAVETARPVVDQAGHALEVSLPAEPLHLAADLTRLSQVFSNLLANAAKYTERGGHLAVTARREADEIVVSVKDDGIGLAPEALPRVFDMFWQVDTAGRMRSGLGIGLALVRGLVELHGGRIEARSEGPGRGSEFVVRLPIVAADAGAERVAEAQPRPRAQGLRVLVVDDNRDSADSLVTLVALQGGNARACFDGAEALRVAEDFRPHLVLMDMGMPVMDGFEATRRLRQQTWARGIAIHALTGWGQDADRSRTAAAGCDGHLVKPVAPEQLEEVLSRVASAATS